MKDFFNEIFEYHHHFNLLLIGEVEKHIADLPERTYPLFCHVLNAHQIWNGRILETATFGTHDLHAPNRCVLIEDSNYTNTLTILEQFDLDKKIQYTTFAGQPYINSVRDILFHVNNHSTHHRAQIISDFRQQGIIPIVTDYIFYKR